MQLDEMTWEENREAISQSLAVLVPVGSTEQHGPHLPVNNDVFCAARLAAAIAAAARTEGMTVAVATALPFGVSEHHMAFPGTISLRRETLVEVLCDVGSSLLRHGWKALVFVNGHGGNSGALHQAAGVLASRFPDALVIVHEWWHLIIDKLRGILTTGLCHACEGETSLSLALGQRVLEERMVSEIPPRSSQFSSWNLLDRVFALGLPSLPVHAISSSGVIGDPRAASREKGEAIIREVVDRSLLMLREIAQGKLGKRR